MSSLRRLPLGILDVVTALLDAATALFGRAIAWVVLFMVLMTFLNVALRYLYGISIVMFYESVLYGFAITLTAAAGWTLLRDEHVRVDVLYRTMRPRWKAVINILGTLLLLTPMLYVMTDRSISFIERAWRLQQASSELAGLPFVYLLKSLILVFVAVVAVQAVSFVLKNLRTLIIGQSVDPGDALAPRWRALATAIATLGLMAGVVWVIITRAYAYVETSWLRGGTGNEFLGLQADVWLKAVIIAMITAVMVQGLIILVASLRAALTGVDSRFVQADPEAAVDRAAMAPMSGAEALAQADPKPAPVAANPRNG